MFAEDPGPVPPFEYDDGEEWVRLPRRSGPLRRFALVSGVLMAIVAVVAFSVVRWVDRQINPSGPPGDPVVLSIEPRQTTNSVINELADAGVIGNATVFRLWLGRQSGSTTFQAGEYELFERMRFRDVLETLRAGPLAPAEINVTVPPGLTIDQMVSRLAAQLSGVSEEDILRVVTDPSLEPDYLPDLPFPIREGLFFPDTYAVAEETTHDVLALLSRMRDQMDRVLEEIDAAPRAEALGRTVYEVLIVASLIEKEALIDEDRPLMARVMYNRLEQNEPLGIDATTAYAVGKLAGEPLTVSDLDSDSPYNTRKMRGLPPTPIALPGRASIEAALSPADGEWFYYARTDEGGVTGAHTFAVTAEEFAEAVAVCRDLGHCR